MGSLQRGGALDRDLERFLEKQAAAVQPLAQGDAFNQLGRDFPKASGNITERVAQEKQRLGC